MRCAVVIPCLNEAAAIHDLVLQVRAFVPNVIVVDDGSNDATMKLAIDAGAEVLRHESTRGKGAALNTGLQRAMERGFGWALAMDGDGQHLAVDIPKFISAAKNHDADLIVGNRFENPRGMPWLRREVNRWMSRRLSCAAGISLPDSQCGFRLLRLKAWSRVVLEAKHFEVESEMLLVFAERNFKIRFVPVQTVYGMEQSKINPVLDTWRWFRWWAKMKGESASATCHLPEFTAPLSIHARKGD